MELVFKGILTGLFLSVFIGATFFMLIETSMTRGFRAALWFDLGVISCDALLIASAYFFTAWINRTLVENVYFTFAGGIAFVGFGVNYIVARRKTSGYQAKKHPLKLVLNGFFLNLLNPSVIIFWLGTMAITLTSFKLSGKQVLVYFATTLGVVILFDIIKAYFAYKISHLLNPRILQGVYFISGILLIGFGVYILLSNR